MSDKGWHVLQVLGMISTGTALLIAGVFAGPAGAALIPIGAGIIGAGMGNAAPQNLVSRGNGTIVPPKENP